MNDLSTKRAFMAHFFEVCKTGKSYREAYAETENLHFSIHGRRKYANYATFRVVRNRFKSSQTTLQPHPRGQNLT